MLITGQQLLTGNKRLESEEINASELASGIYIAEVTNANFNAQKRKKIVLQ